MTDGAGRRHIGPRAVAMVALLVLLAPACSSGDSDGAEVGKRGRRATVTSAAAVVTATTAPVRASGPSSGCDVTPAASPGATDERMPSGGNERSYRLIVPAGYDGSKPLPLVLALHSLTVDYRIVPGMAGFGDMDDAYDFIGVSPSGLLGPTSQPYWNAAPVDGNYDLAFLTALLDHLEATLCVDTGRVFSLGMSNGAQMSSLLACRLGDRIAAIAPIAGVEYNEPCAGPPVPVIAFHGTEDPWVPYEGGGLNSVTIASQNFYGGQVPAGTATPTGVDESMRRWAEHNGCDAGPTETRISDEVGQRTWTGCEAATVLYTVDGGGHAWPGKPQPAFEATMGHGTSDIDATDLAFRLFLDHES